MQSRQAIAPHRINLRLSGAELWGTTALVSPLAAQGAQAAATARADEGLDDPIMEKPKGMH
jgi:hypothetical protein